MVFSWLALVLQVNDYILPLSPFILKYHIEDLLTSLLMFNNIVVTETETAAKICLSEHC